MSRNRLALFALLIALPTFAKKSRPNLVFCLSDDHRWDSLGCAGHGILKTLVLDELTPRYTFTRYFEQEKQNEHLNDLMVDPAQLKNFATDPEYVKMLAKMRKLTDELRDEFGRPLQTASTTKVS